MAAGRPSWEGDGVADNDPVVADQDLLDEQPDHALALGYIQSFG